MSFYSEQLCVKELLENSYMKQGKYTGINTIIPEMP